MGIEAAACAHSSDTMRLLLAQPIMTGFQDHIFGQSEEICQASIQLK